MKTLIVYASKYGFTKEVVDQIKQSISHSCNVVNIKNENISKQAIESVDNIIIAASMYVGAINKKMQEFIASNETDLMKKNIGIVVMAMQKDDVENEITSNFSKELLNHSTFAEWIGGKFNIEKMSWMDKMIVKKVANCKETTTLFFDEKFKSIVNTIEKWG